MTFSYFLSTTYIDPLLLSHKIPVLPSHRWDCYWLLLNLCSPNCDSSIPINICLSLMVALYLHVATFGWIDQSLAQILPFLEDLNLTSEHNIPTIIWFLLHILLAHLSVMFLAIIILWMINVLSSYFLQSKAGTLSPLYNPDSTLSP